MTNHYGNPVIRWTERNGVIVVQEGSSPGEWLRQWCAENGYALPSTASIAAANLEPRPSPQGKNEFGV